MDAWQNLKNITGCRRFDESNSEKTGQKFFSDEETVFLEKSFWRLPYPYRNDLISYYFYNKCRNTSWTRIKCFLRFVILGNTRRKKLTFFSLECLLFVFFFQNTSFSTTYQVFENWPFYLHQICLNTSWSVIKLLWTSAKLGLTRKNVKLFFFHWKGNIFSKTSVFNIHSVVAEMIL